MLLLDVLIRYPTATLLLLVAFLSWRDGRHIQQARLGAYVGLSMAALLIGTAPEALQLPSPVYEIVRILDVPNLALLWLFGLSLFDDEFRMGWREWLVFGVYIVMVMPFRLNAVGWFPSPTDIHSIIMTLFSASLAGQLIWTAISGRRGDLIASRRTIRLWFALGLGLSAASTVTAELFFESRYPGLVSILRAFVTLPLALWSLLWLTQLHAERLLFRQVARPERAELAEPTIDPKDAATHKRLIEIMETERIYTEHGLTISKLSAHISVPEHQLRALINNGLGHRNFAAFLNTYRLAYAKTVLSDPEQARLPVLTIAMDAGYASLATFNRAFKGAEEQTPTEFRRLALSKTP